MAWKNGSADQYIVWNVDSNGNWTSQTGVVSGSEQALQSLETTFQQDLNADGTTGLKTTPIETSGATRLDQVANQFFLHDSGGNGPSLKYAGQSVRRRPVRGLDTDRRGEDWQRLPGGLEERRRRPVHRLEPRQQRQLDWNARRAWCQARSMTLQISETTFQQDLNADGTTGLKSRRRSRRRARRVWTRWPTSSSCTTAAATARR